MASPDSLARSKVHDYLEAQGFDRIQFSVFVGKTDAHHWQKVWAYLEKLFAQRCKSEDKIYSRVIAHDHFKNMRILGQPIDTAWILHEIDVWFV